MKNFIAKKILPALLLLLIGTGAFAQNAPFRNEILQYKKIDSIQAVPANPIVFIGSSSFRLWKNLPGAFPGYPVVNRGFGGSAIPHLDRYAEDILFPYKPAQIVFYCGENDLTEKGVTGDSVYYRFRNLFQKIRERLPDVPFVFVALKPSPSREALMPQVKRANGLIAMFLSEQPNTAFIDVFSKMINSEGKPMRNLFGPDMLHMNSDGYQLWKDMLAPVLLK